MLSFSRSKFERSLSVSGAVVAALALATLNLFPEFKLVNLLLIALAGSLFWAARIAAGSGHWNHTPLDIPVLLIALQMVVSFWATALPETTWVAASQLAAGLVVFYAVVNWAQDRSRLWWAVAVTIALGLGMALLAPFAVDWLTEQKVFLPLALYRPFRLLLPDPIHRNVMAGSMITLIPLPLALALSLPAAPRKRQWLKGALLTVCALQIAILILTRSRGGYVALVVGLWLTLWLSGRRRWALGFLLLCAVLFAVLVTRPQVEVASQTDAAQAALDPSTWGFRQHVWRTALFIIGDFPFTGVGMGTFNDVVALLYGFYSPENPGTHNLFLQVGVDLGILGLTSFLAILLIVLWAGWQARRRLDAMHEPALRAVAVGGLAGIVATITHGLLDHHTWGSKGAFIPWVVMGLVVALHRLTMRPSEETVL